MYYGFNGRIARVDLTKGAVSTEELGEEFYRKFFGGRNFIAYFLLNELKSSCDPLSPDNVLVFAPGVITAAPVAGCGRNSVGAISPLTGGYGESEAGGYFGAALKNAGFDALVVTGQASHPVYLWIHDSQVEIKDARHLWGQTVAATYHSLCAELGTGIRTALIGPAGENLVRYACIINDLSHAAGRNGIGAVMGYKKLKGIVAYGHQRPPLAEPDRIKEIANWLAKNVDTVCGWAKTLGTPGSLMYHNDIDGLPTRNFKEASFEQAEAISGETMHRTILIGRDTCYACPVRCKQVVSVEEPYHVDPTYGGPEYETLVAFGSLCGISDLKAIAKAHELCNAYGLDTITTGALIAWTMECAEDGLVEGADVRDLRFGNARVMLKLIEDITMRRGLGEVLAEGVKGGLLAFGEKAAARAVHVKGQPLPFHEGRVKRGMALGYAISPTGADHCNSLFDDFYVPGAWGVPEMQALGILRPLPMDDWGPEKVRMLIYSSYWKSLMNCMVMCIFMPYSYDQIVEIVRAVTGWNVTSFELAKVGERGLNMARLVNLKQGLTAEDDSLPQRLFDIPVSPRSGGSFVLDRKQFEEAKRLYYQMMGWTEEGIPTRGKLLELGLGWLEE
ncbi:aldehyde ferredoxin oxidoreductase family protein [Moorellaceae bacterium AZ2]